MLSFPNRLPKNEIPQVLRRGMHVRNDTIELVYRKSSGTPRFSFIVSTKIDKRATVRNRMRRTMSESVRHLLPNTPPIDGIFIAKKNFSDLLQTEVEPLISSLLSV
jgi:ribonuclease P protein component